MLLSVETFALLFIFVIDVPSSNGKNAVTQKSVPIFGSEKALLTKEDLFQNEEFRWQGTKRENLTQKNSEGAPADEGESQFSANPLKTREIKLEHPIRIKETKNTRPLNEVEKNEMKQENQFLTKAKEDKEEKLAVKPITCANLRKGRKVRLNNPVCVEIRDNQRTDFRNSVPFMQKREPRQPSGIDKPGEHRPDSKDSQPYASSKLKKTLHSFSRTLSKAKHIVKLPQSISRSISSSKLGIRRSNSPQEVIGDPLTSGYVRKPSGPRLSSSEKMKGLEGTASGSLRWLPKVDPRKVPEKSPPPSPPSNQVNTQQIWDFIRRNSNRLSRSESNEVEPPLGVQPPSPPMSRSPERQSREAGMTNSEGEERNRIDGFISRSRSNWGTDLGSPAANEGLQQNPTNAPSPRMPQPQRGSPSSSSSSTPSPRTTTGGPRPQLRRRLSNNEINDQYNELSKKLRAKQ